MNSLEEEIVWFFSRFRETTSILREKLTFHEGVSPENPMSEGTKKAGKNVLPNHLVGRAELDSVGCLLRC
jgi:hypothetical protein